MYSVMTEVLRNNWGKCIISNFECREELINFCIVCVTIFAVCECRVSFNINLKRFKNKLG